MGGYGRGWSWTGLTTNATLWAWLKLLALPLALATLPLWLKSHGKMSGTRRATLTIAAAAFAIFVFLGYWLDWKWTGFEGNTLWDWFEVLLLPFVIATVKYWTAERTIQPWHRWLLAGVCAGFVVFVVFAYLLPIGWSGFSDNTLFDWVRLLLVPLLMPLLIVPAATDWVTTGIREDDPEPVTYEIWLSADRKLTAEVLPGAGEGGRRSCGRRRLRRGPGDTSRGDMTPQQECRRVYDYDRAAETRRRYELARGSALSSAQSERRQTFELSTSYGYIVLYASEDGDEHFQPDFTATAQADGGCLWLRVGMDTMPVLLTVKVLPIGLLPMDRPDTEVVYEGSIPVGEFESWKSSMPLAAGDTPAWGHPVPAPAVRAVAGPGACHGAGGVTRDR